MFVVESRIRLRLSTKLRSCSNRSLMDSSDLCCRATISVSFSMTSSSLMAVSFEHAGDHSSYGETKGGSNAFDPSCIKSCWITFSPRGISTFIMRNNVSDRMSSSDCSQQISHGFNLFVRKGICSIVQVDQLNADRKVIHASTPVFHSRSSGMPGAFIFLDVCGNRSIAINSVVTRNLTCRVSKVLYHLI
jgi:hypothetical protein